MKILLKKRYCEGLEEDSSIFRKISFYIIERPLFIIRRFTIPLLEDDTWSRNWSSITPFFGFLFFLGATERNTQQLLYIYINNIVL